MLYYYYLHLCLLKGMIFFFVRLFQNMYELCIRNNIDRLQSNGTFFHFKPLLQLRSHMHIQFVYESIRLCKFCHLCAWVVISKELL